MKSRFTNKKNSRKSAKSAKRYSRIITKPSKTRSVKRQSRMTKTRNSMVAKVELTFSIWGHGLMAGHDLRRELPTDFKNKSSNIKVWLMGLKNAGICSLRLDSHKSPILKQLIDPDFDLKQDHAKLKHKLEGYYESLVSTLNTRPYVYKRKHNILLQNPNNDVWLYSRIDPTTTGNKLYTGEPNTEIIREVPVFTQGPTIYFHKIVLLDTRSNIISSTHLDTKIFVNRTISMYTLFQDIYDKISQIVKDNTTHKSSLIDNPKLSLYVYDDTCTYNDTDTIIPFREPGGAEQTAQTEFLEKVTTPTPIPTHIPPPSL